MASVYDDPEYKRNRKRVLKDYDNICYRCRGFANTADHIVPVSLGGGHNYENLRAACVKCNTSRGNRVDDLYREEWFDPTLLSHI